MAFTLWPERWILWILRAVLSAVTINFRLSGCKSMREKSKWEIVVSFTNSGNVWSIIMWLESFKEFPATLMLLILTLVSESYSCMEALVVCLSLCLPACAAGATRRTTLSRKSSSSSDVNLLKEMSSVCKVTNFCWIRFKCPSTRQHLDKVKCTKGVMPVAKSIGCFKLYS